ncbi:MAG: hypothetical protein WAK97_22520, partial [Pseudolabrys sp.]
MNERYDGHSNEGRHQKADAHVHHRLDHKSVNANSPILFRAVSAEIVKGDHSGPSDTAKNPTERGKT